MIFSYNIGILLAKWLKKKQKKRSMLACLINKVASLASAKRWTALPAIRLFIVEDAIQQN